MKALFLTFTCFSEKTGVGQKIKSQIEAIRSLGYTSVFYGRVDEKSDVLIDDENFGHIPSLRSIKELRSFYNKLSDYIINLGISFIYYRFNSTSNPFQVPFFKRLKKASIKQIVEVPTYPYDGEKDYWNRFSIIDRLTRRRLMKQFDYVVTFSTKKEIFGQRTITISNGVDFDKVPLVNPIPHDEINLLGVANLTLWHGYDRIINGLEEYYGGVHHKDVIFHIVSGYETPYVIELKKIVEAKGLSDRVVFHGEVNGKDLDELFNICDLAIGSLGRHRNGITHLKTLKNVEYAARGVPFVYSEINDDFDDKEYVTKIRPDDSPTDIKSVIDFIESVNITPKEIRNSVDHLSWKRQFEHINSILKND